MFGYCEKCHKFAQVRVSGHALAMAGARRVITGICGHCEDQEDKERRDRWLRGRGQ